MILYLVRHGESIDNRDNILSGWSQASLSPSGIADAKRAGEFLQKVAADKIYTSDLPRAVETCQNALPGAEYEALPLIREINIGSLTNLPSNDAWAQFGSFMGQRMHADDYSFWGGEAPEELDARAKQFLDMLLNEPCENVIAFSHGEFIMHLCAIALDTKLNKSHIYPTKGGIIALEYKYNRWWLRCWDCYPKWF
jgi:broad specificity phosphatase PhoE